MAITKCQLLQVIAYPTIILCWVIFIFSIPPYDYDYNSAYNSNFLNMKRLGILFALLAIAYTIINFVFCKNTNKEENNM